MNKSTEIQSTMSECLRGASDSGCRDNASGVCKSKLDFKCLCNQPPELEYVFRHSSTCIVGFCDPAAISDWVSLASAECSTNGIDIKTVVPNNLLLQFLQTTDVPSISQGAGFTLSTLTRNSMPYTARSTASGVETSAPDSLASRMDAQSLGSSLAILSYIVVGGVIILTFACILMIILWCRVKRREKKSYYASQKGDHSLNLGNDLPELAAGKRTHEMDALGEAAELAAPLSQRAVKKKVNESGVTTVNPEGSEGRQS